MESWCHRPEFIFWKFELSTLCVIVTARLTHDRCRLRRCGENAFPWQAQDQVHTGQDLLGIQWALTYRGTLDASSVKGRNAWRIPCERGLLGLASAGLTSIWTWTASRVALHLIASRLSGAGRAPPPPPPPRLVCAELNVSVFKPGDQRAQSTSGCQDTRSTLWCGAMHF